MDYRDDSCYILSHVTTSFHHVIFRSIPTENISPPKQKERVKIVFKCYRWDNLPRQMTWNPHTRTHGRTHPHPHPHPPLTTHPHCGLIIKKSYVIQYRGLLFYRARCSSVVTAFAHGAMGCRIDPS